MVTKIQDPSAPENLYKYQPISDYALQNLEKNQLWASHPSTFNDPFEFKFNQIGKNTAHNEVDKLINELEQFKVICLSEEPLNILMWSHYAAQHKGMCIGFTNELVTYPVIYSDDFPQIDLTNSDDVIRGLQMLKVINSKSSAWSYEKERRIALVPNSPSEVRYPGKLCMIAFGVNTPQSDIEKVKAIVDRKDVKYYKCGFELNQYKLKLDSI